MPQPPTCKASKDVTKTGIPAPVTAQAQAGHQRAASKEVAVTQPPPLVRKNSSGEYGRLFIKVVKLKDLELPLPEGILPLR
jgi:hypothetical protein